jgi:hypothetical protein
MTIPFMAPWPADFSSLWVFHDCPVGRDNPYLAKHQVCGPVGDMIYPPLLYWSFAWTRWLRFDAAGHLWTVFVALGSVLSILA